MDMSVKLSQAYTPIVTSLAVSSDKDPSAATVKAPDAVTPVDQAATREDLEKAVGKIREFASDNHRNLDFSIDDSTGKVVVKVVATDTGEVVRQIPSETALKLAQNLNDANSLLFKDEA
ncbi:flagellar protein FlaG [Pseudomonas cremoricolorata]|uniref:Flagellar protein FlaG n=1 Tax=Pseudomonas cremoricolorata TaxID=157783 RepID=A0A089WL94_9PSED|nr:flagellar protein FlaG [Pseudomonas cremoricolorata]AIR90065.1 flagellar protein FlaG [Pseudomonas cremoricolorata]